MVAGVLRLGFVANFISEPVLKGFIVGLALTIMVGQVPKLFGVESGTGDFFERAWDFLINIDQTDGLTLLVGVGSLAVLFGVPRVAPAIPGPLAAVVLGIGPSSSSTSAPTGWQSSARSTLACLRSVSPTSASTASGAWRPQPWG